MTLPRNTSSDGSNEGSSPDERQIPQDDFPEESLTHVVEGRADGSERCILYPADAPHDVVETNWIAVDGSVPVDAVENR
ncbi:hypothetical protein QA599_04275 [Haloarculaceae archaeon H-GB1-1]|nr:hypothetical protein [Haloarculaceae archaeon H-GB1-1]